MNSHYIKPLARRNNEQTEGIQTPEIRNAMYYFKLVNKFAVSETQKEVIENVNHKGAKTLRR
jgi:hypothetical protein